MKKNREVQIAVIRSRRKTIALQIREDGSVLVRAPYWMTNTEISHFVKEKKDWIRRHLDKLEENVKLMLLPADPEDKKNVIMEIRAVSISLMWKPDSNRHSAYALFCPLNYSTDSDIFPCQDLHDDPC